MPLLNKPLVSSANFQRTEQEIASLQKEVASQQQQSTASSNVPAPSVPQPCTGGTFEGSNGFVIAAQVDKKGEFDTFCAMIPAGCTRLGTLIGKFADQGIRDNTIFHWVDVPDDIAAAGGHFEYMFPLNLRYNTKYGLIQLIAVVEDPVTGLTGRKKNPLKPWNPQTQEYSYLDTWTTGNALNAPATPICLLDPTGATGDIIENTTYADRDGGHARLTLRAYFAADRTKTAGQMEATKIGVRLKYAAGGGFLQASAVATNETDKFEDITISDLPEGQQLVWQDVWTKHGTGRAFSTVANCAITAGNTNTDAGQFATMCSGANITFAQVDAHHAKATLTYNQPSPPFALKKIQLQRSDDGGATWSIDQPADRPIAEAAVTTGLQTVVYLVKTKAAVNHLFRVHFLARPGLDGFSPNKSNTGLGDATGDLGPASVVTNFTATWEAANVTFKWKRPTSNANSIVNYNVWITEPSASPLHFMQALSDGTTKAGQAAITQTKPGSLVQSGHHITTKIKKALLDGNFNPTFRVHVTANNVVNGVITEGAELTADVTVGVDYLNSTDAVNVVSPNVLLLSTLNELSNGDFHRARNTGASRSWTVGVAGGFIPAVPFPGGSTGTGLDFDVTNHWVHWYAFVPGPAQKLGDPGLSTAGMAININPGDNKTVGLRMWSLNGPHTLSFNCILRTDTGINVALVPFSVALTSQAQLVQVSIAVPSGNPFPGANAIFLLLTSADGLITALNDVIIDGIGMNGGQTFISFTSHPSIETNQNGVEGFDALPNTTSSGTSPGVIASPTGPAFGTVTQGGGAAPGFARVLNTQVL